jgi:hypothetical protein
MLYLLLLIRVLAPSPGAARITKIVIESASPSARAMISALLAAMKNSPAKPRRG